MDLVRPAKTLARTGVRTWGSLTSGLRPPPEFLVIGAKRGGTTTVFRSLQAHPDVRVLFPASQGKKSPHYFDLDYPRGERWYRSHFATAWARRPVDGRRVLTGEASPYYLFHPHAPARIGADLPDVKLIAMLRNPVDRAFSHHWDRTKNGIEDLPFAEAIDREEERLAGELERLLADPTAVSHSYEHFSYAARGRYAEQLERVFAHIPRPRVLVLRSEDFYERPQEQYERVLGFLGLAHHAPAEYGKLHGHADRPEVPADVRARLDEHFAPHNARLAELLGTEVWW